MIQAMFSGVSGLGTQQTDLDVIGNNIANVNTIGFKAGSVTFETQLSQTLKASASPTSGVGGQNPTQVGLGVTLGAVATDQTQGNLESTDSSTDMAIQGNGYFLVSDGTNVYYTRDGAFDLDSNGDLVNSATGMKLLGYVADANGNIDTSQHIDTSSDLKIPIGTATSVEATSASSFDGNLDASSALQSTKVSVNGELDTSLPSGNMTTTIYDSQGNAHSLTLSLANPVHDPPAGAGVPAGATQRWTATVTLDGNALTTQTLYAIPNGSGGNTFVFTDNANPANSLGSALDLTVPASNGVPSFPLTLDFSKLQATSNVTTAADGQGGNTPAQSTLVTMNGNLNLDGASPVTNTTAVYAANGTEYTVTTSLSNPAVPAAGAGVPANATQQWDMKVTVDTVPPTGATTVYDSSVAANNESKVYYVPGTGFITSDANNPADSLGSTIQLVAGALPPGSANQGLQTGTGFPLSIDLSKLTTTSVTDTANGQGGASPVWNSALTVYDSLGVAHNLNFQFTRSLIGPGAPTSAAGEWNWTATENGVVVGSSSSSSTNSPLYFNSAGDLLNTQKQGITVTPVGGASTLPITVDFSALTQLSGSSSVAANSQNGSPVGTLQSFAISDGGLISGVFSNGQSRTLGQIATATFSNPAGLTASGDNLYSGSSNSGLAQVGLPGNSGRGSISTGFLEMSNVDLSTEFTNLIVAERGFQANTRIITVVDSMLQDVVGLIR